MSLLGTGRHCRLIEVFWTSCLLADQDPMPPPCPVLVVSVLVLVMRGGSGRICSAGVDALRYAGPSVIVRGFRPLRHCGRAGYGRRRAIGFSFHYSVDVEFKFEPSDSAARSAASPFGHGSADRPPPRVEEI